MGRQDHTPARDDLWDLTLRTVGSFDGMDAAIQRLSADLYTRDRALSKLLPELWMQVHQTLWDLDYEQEGIPREDLANALRELTKVGSDSEGVVRKALVRADQILGRAKFLKALAGQPPPAP